MNSIDLSLWTFEPPLQPGSMIVCSECKAASLTDEWKESSVYCEDCGDHQAIRCPQCDWPFDHIFAKPFLTLTPAAAFHLSGMRIPPPFKD